MKIHETKAYDNFEMHQFNRDVKKTKALEKSMLEHGFISAYPLHVTKNGGKLQIKAGHHRYTVARKLGIPVKYVVCDDAASIHELEEATSKWTYADFLESHCRVGNQDYLEIRRYCHETGIPLTAAISMHGGQWAGSGNFGGAFKNGKFKIRDRRHPNIIRDIVYHMKKCGVESYSANLMVCALSRLIFVEEFNVETFKQKVKNHTHLCTKQANLQEYMRMVETLYNRQSSKKVPLVFLAEVMAKDRNVVRKNMK